MKILKYNLVNKAGLHTISMPAYPSILGVIADEDGIKVMAITNEKNSMEYITFNIYKTGDEFFPYDSGTYIGTCQFAGIEYHVFQKIEKTSVSY